MTLTATCFVINTPGTEQAALGLLCPGARYAGVLWPGAGRIDRKFGTPEDWASIQREIGEGLSPTPLPKDMACVRVLAGGLGARVQWMWGMPVEVEAPEGAAAALDGLLRSAAS